MDGLRLYHMQAMTFLLASALPVFIGELMLNEAPEAGWVAGAVLVATALVLEVLSGAAAMLLTCKLLQGERSELRSLLRLIVRAPLGVLILTFAAVLIVVAGGAILLIVPGVIFLARLMLAPAAVLLERCRVDASFRRSRELGRGFYARNLGIAFAAFWLPIIVLNVLFAAFSDDGHVGVATYSAIYALLSPLEAIVITLVYLDMRVRKEELDAVRFAEEMDRAYGDGL